MATSFQRQPKHSTSSDPQKRIELIHEGLVVVQQIMSFFYRSDNHCSLVVGVDTAVCKFGGLLLWARPEPGIKPLLVEKYLSLAGSLLAARTIHQSDYFYDINAPKHEDKTFVYMICKLCLHHIFPSFLMFGTSFFKKNYTL